MTSRLIRNLCTTLAFLLPLPAFANLSAEFPVTQTTFEIIPDNAWATGASKLAGFLGPEQQQLIAILPSNLRTLGLEFLHAQGIWGARLKQPQSPEIQTRLLEFVTKASSLLKEHFETTARAHGAQIIQKEGYTTYKIEDGVGFYRDFLGSPDPEKRIVARTFLNSPYRAQNTGEASKFFQQVLSEDGVTRVLSVGRLTDNEWKSLAGLLTESQIKMARHGQFITVGSGPSFHLTDEILAQAEKLQDANLKKKMARVLAYLNKSALPIEVHPFQGATAYFDPNAFKMVYGHTGSINADAFAHEITHARFSNFLEQLESWTKKKNYALPYEIDGPRQPGSKLGGYMNLLNELNSWRTGLSFSNPSSKPPKDAKILDILRLGYGAQAGKQSAETFGKIWPAKEVHGTAVPRIILNSVRKLNELNETQMVELGKKGLANRDFLAQKNFLNLFFARYGKTTEIPKPVLDQLDAFAREGLDLDIRLGAKVLAAQARQINPNDVKFTAEEFAKIASTTATGQISINDADGFVKSLDAKNLILPEQSILTYNDLLHPAVTENAQNYEQVIQAAKKAGAGASYLDSPETKALFNNIFASQGATFKEKFENYLTRWNSQGFKEVWDQLIHTGKVDAVNLLASKHLDSFGPKETLSLFQMTLKNDNPQPAQTLLGLVLEKKQSEGKIAQIYSKELDEALAGYIFNGNPGADRKVIVNLLSNFTKPTEFPLVMQKLRESLAKNRLALSKKSNLNNLNVALTFIDPPATPSQTRNEWGVYVTDELRKNPDILPPYVGEFHRLSLAPFLPDLELDPHAPLNADARTAILKRLESASPQQKEDLARGMKDLMRALESKNTYTATSAAYALRSYPGYLAKADHEIAQQMKNKNPMVRYWAIRLLSMVNPGFLPETEKEVAQLNLSIRSKALLTIQKPLTQTQPWCSKFYLDLFR